MALKKQDVTILPNILILSEHVQYQLHSKLNGSKSEQVRKLYRHSKFVTFKWSLDGLTKQDWPGIFLTLLVVDVEDDKASMNDWIILDGSSTVETGIYLQVCSVLEMP